MTMLRLVLAALLLAVGALDLVNGPPSPFLTIVGIAVGVALLVTVALDLLWRARESAQTAP